MNTKQKIVYQLQSICYVSLVLETTDVKASGYLFLYINKQ